MHSIAKQLCTYQLEKTDLIKKLNWGKCQTFNRTCKNHLNVFPFPSYRRSRSLSGQRKPCKRPCLKHTCMHTAFLWEELRTQRNATCHYLALIYLTAKKPHLLSQFFFSQQHFWPVSTDQNRQSSAKTSSLLSTISLKTLFRKSACKSVHLVERARPPQSNLDFP